jgi:DNA-binding CsgD family transcriptional regulator
MGQLTAREREAALLLAQGKTPVQIAEVMCVNRRTVYTYLERVRLKTFADSTIDLAVKVALYVERA